MPFFRLFWIGGKSGNKGRCTQSCRRLYEGDDGSKGYFFSTKDLMLIEKLPDLIKLGINSLKIEGRMKNARYVKTVVKAYRYVIDNYENEEEEVIKKALTILDNDLTREKTTFYFNDFNLDFILKIFDFVKKINFCENILKFIMDFNLSKS